MFFLHLKAYQPPPTPGYLPPPPAVDPPIKSYLPPPDHAVDSPLPLNGYFAPEGKALLHVGPERVDQQPHKQAVVSQLPLSPHHQPHPTPVSSLPPLPQSHSLPAKVPVTIKSNIK
jgi:hypothetical protein